MNSILLGELTTDETTTKSANSDTDVFEYYLRNGVFGALIKQVRNKRNMTQSELGKLLGVQRAQISKLENNTKDFRVGTVIRAIEALRAKVKLSVEMESLSPNNLKQ